MSLAFARRLDREVVVVLVLEVAGLVGAQAGEGLGHRRRLQPDGGDALEIDDVRTSCAPSLRPEAPPPNPSRLRTNLVRWRGDPILNASSTLGARPSGSV